MLRHPLRAYPRPGTSSADREVAYCFLHSIPHRYSLFRVIGYLLEGVPYKLLYGAHCRGLRPPTGLNTTKNRETTVNTNHCTCDKL